MQILPFAQKHLIKIAFSLGLYLLSSLALASFQSIEAAIDYGDQMCGTERPLDCPAGMKVGGVGNGAISCLAVKSKYCELLTGDSTYDDYNADTTSYERCNSKVLGNTARCVSSLGQNFLEVDDTNIQGQFKDLFLGLDGSLLFTGNPTNQPKFYPGQFVVTATAASGSATSRFPTMVIGLNGYNSQSTDSFFCTPDQQPIIPTFDFADNIYLENSDGDTITYQNKAEYINKIRESGFRIRKDLTLGLFPNNNFCGNPSDIFNRNTNTCISGISSSGNMRPCVANITNSSGNPTPLCVRGTNANFRTGLSKGEIVNLFENDGRVNNHSQNLDIDPAFNNGNINACDRTSQEVLKLRSNKGCSEYMIYDTSNYSLKKGEKYDECSRCLYGENAVERRIKEDEIGNYTIKLTNGQTVEASSTDLSGLTIDNEPFFDPLPGRIYSDLGCVDTSSTPNLINTILRVALVIMGGIVILRIIQGALTMQAGDPESFEEGRNIIISAVVGLVVLILSAAILNFLGVNILQLDSNNSGFQPFGPSN